MEDKRNFVLSKVLFGHDIYSNGGARQDITVTKGCYITVVDQIILIFGRIMDELWSFGLENFIECSQFKNCYRILKLRMLTEMGLTCQISEERII